MTENLTCDLLWISKFVSHIWVKLYQKAKDTTPALSHTYPVTPWNSVEMAWSWCNLTFCDPIINRRWLKTLSYQSNSARTPCGLAYRYVDVSFLFVSRQKYARWYFNFNTAVVSFKVPPLASIKAFHIAASSSSNLSPSYSSLRPTTSC